MHSAPLGTNFCVAEVVPKMDNYRSETVFISVIIYNVNNKNMQAQELSPIQVCLHKT